MSSRCPAPLSPLFLTSLAVQKLSRERPVFKKCMSADLFQGCGDGARGEEGRVSPPHRHYNPCCQPVLKKQINNLAVCISFLMKSLWTPALVITTL